MPLSCCGARHQNKPARLGWPILVPLTGLEPVRVLPQGILSPWCLPIPPQRHIQLALLVPISLRQDFKSLVSERSPVCGSRQSPCSELLRRLPTTAHSAPSLFLPLAALGLEATAAWIKRYPITKFCARQALQGSEITLRPLAPLFRSFPPNLWYRRR